VGTLDAPGFPGWRRRAAGPAASTVNAVLKRPGMDTLRTLGPVAAERC